MHDLRDFDTSKKSVVKRLALERKSNVLLEGEHFPRIHDLDEISRTVALISEFGEVTHLDIGRKSEQGLNHIFHSCKLLGLLTDKLKNTRLTNHFHLKEEREKLGIISIGIERSKVVTEWKKWSSVDSLLKLDISSAKEFTLEMNQIIKPSTIKSRASSLKSLVSQAMNFHPSVFEDIEFLLPPINSLIRNNEIQPENIFESSKAELTVKKLAKGSRFIRAASGFFSIEGYDILASKLESAQIRIIIGDKDIRGRNDLSNPTLKFKQSIESGSNSNWKKMALQRLHKELLFGSTRVSNAFARQHESFHAKVYIFDRSAVLQGSMNTSITGFRFNIENADVKTAVEDIDYFINKFDEHFMEANPIETELIELISESWAMDDVQQIDPGLAYLRILLELYDREVDPSNRTDYEMDDYQRYTSNKATRDISEHGGCLLVAPTGTGKSVMGSFVALNLYNDGLIDRVIVVSPGHLENSWKKYMLEFKLGATTERLSFFREQKGNAEDRMLFANSLCKRDLVIIDECHGVKNEDSIGAKNLLAAIGPPGGEGPLRLLMTATPYSKDLDDLNNLLKFIHPTASAKKALDVASLPGVAYLTHPLIANQFAKLIDGKKAVKFDRYMYFPIKATCTKTYQSNHQELFELLEALDLTTKVELNKDKYQQTIVSDAPEFGSGYSLEIIRWIITKIAESSPAALKSFVQNQLSSDLESKYLNHEFLRHQYESILELISREESDPKLELLLESLNPLVDNDHKIIIFTEYKGTVNYLERALSNMYPNRSIKTITGDLNEDKKLRLVKRFAPVAHGLSKRVRKDDIQILIATDCISEGQNLQDATLLVNYDLTWTPLKLIQRIGRLDRPTPHHRTFGVWNFFPGQNYFEKAIGIRRRLKARSDDYRKMAGIDVVQDGVRNLDQLTEEELEHVERIYSAEEVDFEQVLNSFMPATEYIRRLAIATKEQISEAWSLPIGTMAVHRQNSGIEGIVCLVRDPQANDHIIWKERDGKVQSRFTGMSQEVILQRITADIGSPGSSLPSWFETEQKLLLLALAEELDLFEEDLIPTISIAVINSDIHTN